MNVQTDHLILDNYIVTGVAFEVIRDAMEKGKNPEEAVAQVLELGASVLQYGSSRTTVESVSSEIQRIIDRLQYVSQNEYSQILNQHKVSINDTFSQFLDPGRSSSVQSQVQSLVKEYGLNAQQAMNTVLNDPNGPFASLKAQFENKIGGIEGKQVDILKDLSAISERLKMTETLEDAYQKSTSKGLDHEASILQIVERFVTPLKDQVIDVSKDIGLDGSKKGDAMVKINEDEIKSASSGYVIEAKDQKLTLPAALKELELGMSNRGVKVGILVFAHKEQLPTNGSPFRLYSGNRILVALGDGNVHLELEVACNLARSIALQLEKEIAEDTDIDHIYEKVDKLSTVIEEARGIEKGTSIAKKGIEAIEASYKKLREEALGIISDIQVKRP